MPELLAYLKINGMGNMRNGRNGYENELNTDLTNNKPWEYTICTFSAAGIADNFSSGGYIISGSVDSALPETIVVLVIIPLRCESKVTSRRKGIFTATFSQGMINYGADVSSSDIYEMSVGIIYTQ